MNNDIGVYGFVMYEIGKENLFSKVEESLRYT